MSIAALPVPDSIEVWVFRLDGEELTKELATIVGLYLTADAHEGYVCGVETQMLLLYNGSIGTVRELQKDYIAVTRIVPKGHTFSGAELRVVRGDVEREEREHEKLIEEQRRRQQQLEKDRPDIQWKNRPNEHTSRQVSGN